MTHGGFDGGEDHIKTDVDQIDAGKRNHQIAPHDDTLIQHVIENVDERELIVVIGVAEN